jgi:predicted nucleic acid-binding protein
VRVRAAALPRRPGMRLVVDASTLVAEALRARGRRLLAHPQIDLFVAIEAWNETEHELRKRAALVAERGFLDAGSAEDLLDQAITAVAARTVLVPVDAYADRMAEARRRIPRDPRDAPTVALALQLDCGIWTADQDFFGCGVPVWTTETLLNHLTQQ